MTNRIFGTSIFAAVMWLVYYVSITTVEWILTDWTNDVLFGEWIIPAIARVFDMNPGCAEWLTGLILDGIVAGVGAVLGFVPQMLVLFLLLRFLRAAAIWRVLPFMDRIFRKFGLSGKSFIPMLIGSGVVFPASWLPEPSKMTVTVR